MNINDSEQIYGIIQGIQYGQNARVDELNTRIHERQLPDVALRPQFDIRAVSTKYAHFPIIDRRPPIENRPMPPTYLEHSPETNFCPNMSRGPTEYFAQNIDDESKLRNQFFALQKGADQGVYVPSSNSDLYRVPVYGRFEEQPYPYIANFHARTDTPIPRPNVAIGDIGKETFNNCTRTQLRNTVTM